MTKNFTRMLLSVSLPALTCGLATPVGARAIVDAPPAKPSLILTSATTNVAAQAPTATPAPAPADPAAVDEGEAEVVVTGYRASVAKSIDLKRRSDVQLDAITADDIASMPEANIAESLQRIPGVSIDRENGEGRQISVRGLGGDFTRVRINNMEALSTTGSTGGSINTSRGFDFNTFASQLFNSASVRKTPSATVDEGSLGATVDLNAARPFDYKGQKLAIAPEVAYYRNGEHYSPRVAGLYSNRWLDGRMGLLVSGAYQSRDTTTSQYYRSAGIGDLVYRNQAWAGNEYPQRSRFAAPTGTVFNRTVLLANGACPTGTTGDLPRQPTGTAGALQNPIGSICTAPISPTLAGYAISNPLVAAAYTGSDPAAYAALFPSSNATPGRFDDSTVLIPTLTGLGVTKLHTERLGGTASFQFQVTDRTRLSVDFLGSKFNQEGTQYGVETFSGRNGSNATLNTLPTNATAATRRGLYPGLCNQIIETALAAPQDCGQALNGTTLVPGMVNSFNPNNLDPYDYYNSPLSVGFVANDPGAAYNIRNLIAMQGPQTMRVVGANVTDGVANYLAINNMDWRSSAMRAIVKTKFTQLSYTLDHEFSDDFKVSGTAGMSKSKTYSQVLFAEFNALDRPETFVYDARDGGDMPIFNPGFDVANASNWGIVKGLSALRNNENTVDNEFRQVRLDGTWRINDQFTFKFGGAIKNYDFATTNEVRLTDTLNPTEKELGVSVASLGTTHKFGQGLKLPEGTPTTIFAPNIDAFASQIDFDCDCINKWGDFRNTSRRNRGSTYNIGERDRALYGQFDFNTEVFGRELSGNFGMRYVRTSIDAQGFDTTGRIITDQFAYDDYLPSLNLAYDLARDLKLRFGASRAMARSQLHLLSPSVTQLTVPNTGVPSGGTLTVGNTRLEPFRANNLDLSLEWYFRSGSLLSVAVFNKSIESYPQVVLYDASLSTILSPEAIAALKSQFAGSPAQLTYLELDNPFTVRQAQNSPGGYIRGIEANFQTNFFFLPGILKNFGIQLNGTYIKSELNYILDPGVRANGVQSTPAVFGKGPYLNVSPKAFNATLFYQDKVFDARVSVAQRAGYSTTFPIASGACSPGATGSTNTTTPQAASATLTTCASPLINDFGSSASTFNVDVAFGINISDRLSFRVEGLNLTNQTSNRYAYEGNPQVTQYQSTGPQYTAGLRYRF